jgi:hypothetical protein
MKGNFGGEHHTNSSILVSQQQNNSIVPLDYCALFLPTQKGRLLSSRGHTAVIKYRRIALYSCLSTIQHQIYVCDDAK